MCRVLSGNIGREERNVGTEVGKGEAASKALGSVLCSAGIALVEGA